MTTTNVRKFHVFDQTNLDQIAPLRALPPDALIAMRTVAAVLPFRVNSYVVEELINWDNVPDDPIFQLTFPQVGMLLPDDFATMRDLVVGNASKQQLHTAAQAIRLRLNPHPAGQVEHNVPRDAEGVPLPGMQHKYRETVLFFPAAGQTCHAYCTYCFRWPQFVGMDDLKFAARHADQLVTYLKRHPEVTSVLITGGDPMVMKTNVLRRYVLPLLDVETLRSIRIGTKAPAYWPYRFTHGTDADDLSRLFETVRARDKHVAVMAHYSHPRELQPPIAREAVRRIQDAGAVVRCQAPLIRHVNDRAEVWARLWELQLRMGAVPYYMFVERDTGARHYFEVPLARAHRIFHDAYRTLSGLGRTVRGPSMSTAAGKIVVDGVATVAGEKVFVLKFLQARDPAWVGMPFFAHYDEKATWLDDLRPAFGKAAFFFETNGNVATTGDSNLVSIGRPHHARGHGQNNGTTEASHVARHADLPTR